MRRLILSSLAVLFVVNSLIAAPQRKKRDPEPQATDPAAAPAADPAKSPGTASVVDPKTFKLGAEDVLFIRVWREDISGPAAVRPDGMITMPLIGDVQAAGLTPQELSTAITEKLKTYIKNPDVTVMVTQVNSKKYYVTGAVNKTGAFPLAVPTRVLEAITNAGGFREFANQKKITILRGSETFKFNYKEVIQGKNMEQNIFLQPGDYVIVKE